MTSIKSMHHFYSEPLPLNNKQEILHVSESNGLKITFKTMPVSMNRKFHFLWCLTASEELRENFKRRTGYVIVKRVDENMPEKTVKLKMPRTFSTLITFEFPTPRYWKIVKIGFECHIMMEKNAIENPGPEILAPGENDVVLEVDGKITHVNRGFLAAHSDYFECLFSERFADIKKPAIKIGDVSFEDFSLLLSTFYPSMVRDINDDDVVVILELARRFLLPAATEKVEKHLIRKSKLGRKVILELARQFQLKIVLEHVEEKMFRRQYKEAISHDGTWHFPE